MALEGLVYWHHLSYHALIEGQWGNCRQKPAVTWWIKKRKKCFSTVHLVAYTSYYLWKPEISAHWCSLDQSQSGRLPAGRTWARCCCSVFSRAPGQDNKYRHRVRAIWTPGRKRKCIEVQINMGMIYLHQVYIWEKRHLKVFYSWSKPLHSSIRQAAQRAAVGWEGVVHKQRPTAEVLVLQLSVVLVVELCRVGGAAHPAVLITQVDDRGARSRLRHADERLQENSDRQNKLVFLLLLSGVESESVSQRLRGSNHPLDACNQLLLPHERGK